MQNAKILIFVESRYKLSRKRITKAVNEVLAENDVKSDVEVSVAIVGDRKMRSLNNTYRNLDKTTNVLSFPLKEGEQTKMPGNIVRLGDVVLSYPQVIRDAARDEMLVDDKIEELVKHGLHHLLGLHHE